MGAAWVDRDDGERWESGGSARGGWEGGGGGIGWGQHARLKAMDVEDAENADEGGQEEESEATRRGE